MHIENGNNYGLNDKSEKSYKICKRGSNELREYYQTGDLSKIDLENKNIKYEDKDKDYMKALIDNIRELVNEEDNFEDKEDQKILGIHQKLLIKYFFHFLPFIIFFVIGIFSIIGWMVCCLCTCCDCCCCCCCKKEKCKVPCFIFTYIFYALTLATCIYGLVRTNKFFIELANVECSVLKLLEQFLDGEVNQSNPRWIGIKGVIDILDNLMTNIEKLEKGAIIELQKK